MASKFRIFLHQNSGNFHLKLIGDFDGSSAYQAYQLISAITSHNGNASNIYIQTSSLSSIHPFGLDVIKKKRTVNKLTHALIFTGEYADALAPEGSQIF